MRLKKIGIRGFTLMELVITVMVLAIVTTFVASIIGVNFRIMSDVSDRKKLVTRGLMAVNLFQREVALLKNNDDITAAGATNFRFTDAYGNDWRYNINNSTLRRRQIGVGSWKVLASPIIQGSSGFTYYDEDNQTTTNKSNIKLVKLLLVMDDGSSNGIALMAMVYPENFKIYSEE